VTKWTANPGTGFGVDPRFLTVFNDAMWFNGSTSINSQLFKLDKGGALTQWTAVPGGLSPAPVSTAAGDPDSTPLSVFNNALWFQAHDRVNGDELWKLGADNSFTLWKDINAGAGSSFPHDWALL
jgi:ELWxxDGT repeat protein